MDNIIQYFNPIIVLLHLSVAELLKRMCPKFQSYYSLITSQKEGHNSVLVESISILL